MTQKPLRFIALIFLFIACVPGPLKAGEVKVRTATVPIPTYKMGPDEKQPIYRGFKVPGVRVFRADRTTYPYPRADNFGHERQMVNYKVITLENEFIKADVIPDLRGRLQGAYDKRNNWDFLYYNHVIKPGEIANRAGWIAGGLEWNHPGGHGYTQFETLSHKIIENDDGSKTVLVAEIEPVRMMKWETAITLRPGSLAVETEGRFYSIAPYPVPFASSLNAAMHATDGMEAIYPEGSYITGHGKHYVKPWPVYDGVDHRWFRNLTSSYSIFTEGSTEDFFGCYSHDKNAGTVIVGDHRTAPGKKYFSWGAHPAGRRWDTLLSDEDGPYIELQVGAFWENLGYGYAWLDPMEVKKYTIYWYPVKDLGGFVRANEHLALNLTRDGERGAMLGVQAVHAHPGISIVVAAGRQTIYEKTLDLDPAEPFVDHFELASGVRYEDLKVTIRCKKGTVLMTYQPLVKHPPAPALPARRVAPEKAASIDELYMWGAGFYQDPFGEEAESYYQEIVRRKPDDVRGNRALGLMALHRGQWDLAIERLERSLGNDPLNEGFANHYYIGLAALEKQDLGRARDEFTIASRVARLNIPALYHLAIVAMQDGDHRRAARLLREAIEGGGVHPQLQSTLALAFRKLGNAEGAAAARKTALEHDPLEFLAMLEQWKAGGLSAAQIHQQFDRRAPFFVGSQLYVEGAALYSRLGAWDDAASILEEGVRHLSAAGDVYPMVEYYLGSVYARQGKKAKAKAAFASAAKRDSTYVFPYRPLDIAALNAAVESNPADARAWGYMGNALFYLRRYEDAERAWLRSEENDPRDASVLRSLAFVGWALRQDLGRAIERLQKASDADPTDARILLELDYFLDAAGQTARRGWLLSEREATVRTRDELVLAWSRLLLRTGDYAKAVDLMDNRRFFARESRAQSHAVYSEAHYGLGEQLLREGKHAEALAEFQKGMEYPETLGEGALANEVFARAQYLSGLANQNSDAAKQLFRKVAETPVRKDTESAIYQALALRKLGLDDEATKLLRETEALCRGALAEGKGSAPLMNYLLSRTLVELGNDGEAQALLRTALEADADAVLKSRIAASQPPS